MRPEQWNPPIKLSNQEEKIVKRIKRAKLFTFLRESRHLLFDENFQTELSQMYAEAEKGHPPVPPAQLALTTLLQAYTGASDAEAIEALTMDRRWQLVLDCLDCEQAPFSQATLVRFRQALIIHQLDRRLIERTVELAQMSQKLHIDRAYLSSSWVKNRDPELTIYCKAWRVSNGSKFAKSAFVLNWASETITCPNQVSLPFREGGKVQFPEATCLNCPLRKKCTTSKKGRSISIHPDEKFISELRQRQLTPKGRAKLRERVTVEHSLSHIGRWQGDRSRYIGVRKNLFDLRRTAVVHNLHVLIRLLKDDPELFASKSGTA